LYRRFLLTLLRRFDRIAQRRVLAYTPSDKRAEFALLHAEGWALEEQAVGDLGMRMHNYFSAAFRSGAERVVLIGSDSPTLPQDYVTGAFQLLRSFPVVLGPSDDGGYYLVGAAGGVPPIFAGVAWSTPRVWSQTQSLLRAAGYRWGVLPAWYDVDDLPGLRTMERELAGQQPLDETLRELQEDVERNLRSITDNCLHGVLGRQERSPASSEKPGF
jgi:hypothetical protein